MVGTRIALGVQYYGRGWQGWQAQPSKRTVQDTLEEALSRFSDERIRVACAGRTDAGVHAIGQVAHFDTHAVRKPNGWVQGVNALLPESIAVSWCREWPARAVLDRTSGVSVGSFGPSDFPDDFHARFSACARTYHYVLFVHPIRSALLAGRTGWFYRPLDVAAMREAARHLIGTHDFSAFRGSECQAKTPIKTLQRLGVTRSGEFIVFTLRANAFLHHMVRNIVGSLIAVGQGKFAPAWVADLLGGLDRTRAAATFMADGLYLAAVEYPGRFGIPKPPSLNTVFPGLLDDEF